MIETRDGKELLKLVGRRVLLKNRVYSGDEIWEASVIEVSPRGLVKLNMGLVTQWKDPEDYWLVEVLPHNENSGRLCVHQFEEVHSCSSDDGEIRCVICGVKK